MSYRLLTTRILTRWVGLSARAAWPVALAAGMSAVLALVYARDNLGINTDTADMISDRLAWRQTYNDYKRAFPRFTDTLLVVVDGATPDIAERASRRLAAGLRADRALIEWVERPGGSEFFQRHALLYMAPEEIEELGEHLVEVQPFLGTLNAAPGLVGLLPLITRALDESDEPGAVAGLDRVLGAMADAVEAQLAGRFHEVSWRELMLGSVPAPSERRRFVIVKPRLDYSVLLPAGPAMARIREIAGELALLPERGVRVRITGGTALSHEELQSVTRGAQRAGLLALVTVGLVLVIGLRSLRLVLVTLLTLLIGLTWTAAFATAAVGELNLISVAFAVLYIGLGVDYAIHFCLRYQELIGAGHASSVALEHTASDVGSSLAVCAVTTGIAFFAFVPTDFSGVSELGIISGVGMFISLVASLTLLPALLSVVPARASPAIKATRARVDGWLVRVPYRHRRGVLGATTIVALGAALAVPFAWFDDNPLNLRDPASESVSTYRELMADSDTSPWEMVVLTATTDAAALLARRLEVLEEVDHVRGLQDLVPAAQPEKLERIEEIALLLGVVPEVPRTPGSSPPGKQRAAVMALLASLERFESRAGRADAAGGAPRLRAGLRRLVQAGEGLDARTLASLEQRLTGSLPDQLRALYLALEAGPVTADTLPEALNARWRAADGRYRLEIYPTENLADRDALRRFVAAVAEVAPEATGSPLVNLNSGRAVVGAFQQAFVSALVLITLLLAVLLRRMRDTVLVLAPLLLAGTLSVAIMVLVGMPFNFANVIALPLLLGIGVDNGVHIIHRLRSAPPESGNVLLTSTTRAVIVSALTTMCSFGNLAFSPHLGMASMGAVLTIGLCVTLVVTLIVLPALAAGSESAECPPS